MTHSKLNLRSSQPGGMSEVLVEFMEPYLKATSEQPLASLQEMPGKLVTVAVFAWNLSFMPEERRRNTIDQVVASMSGGSEPLRTDMRQVFSVLVERRLRDFSEHELLVVDFEVVGRDDGHQLVVKAVAEIPEE